MHAPAGGVASTDLLGVALAGGAAAGGVEVAELVAETGGFFVLLALHGAVELALDALAGADRHLATEAAGKLLQHPHLVRPRERLLLAEPDEEFADRLQPALDRLEGLD